MRQRCLPSHYLEYDGHSGYDFSFGLNTTIVAPADGTLFLADKDPINGTNGEATAWDGFHTFYIDHSNGYTTWYLHCAALAPEVREETKRTGSAQVNRGEDIAYVGKHGTPSPHLHFEVRRSMDEVVDPYAQRLWQQKRPSELFVQVIAMLSEVDPALGYESEEEKNDHFIYPIAISQGDHYAPIESFSQVPSRFFIYRDRQLIGKFQITASRKSKTLGCFEPEIGIGVADFKGGADSSSQYVALAQRSTTK